MSRRNFFVIRHYKYLDLSFRAKLMCLLEQQMRITTQIMLNVTAASRNEY